MRSFPVIILALAIGPIFGGGMMVLMGFLIATSVPNCARVKRSSVLALASPDYVEALRAMGIDRIRIALRHILPNVIGPILILALMDIPAFIMAEAGISFPGVGVKATDTSWGMILDQGFRFIGHAPWPSRPS